MEKEEDSNMLKTNDKKLFKTIFQILFLGLLVVSAFWLGRLASESEVVREIASQFGHLGVFAVSVASGFNLVVPIPAVVFVPLFLEAGFKFWTLIFIITLGMTVGDSIGYLLGNTGRKLINLEEKEHRTLVYIEKFKKKHRVFPYVLLALYSSFAPFPNEAIVIPMSFAGYRLRFVFPIVFVGNAVFNTISALGIVGIFNLL